MQKLRIGKILYSNVFPIFYTLENEFDCSLYEFIEDVPSELNKMLRQGEIDISPSSSIEYIKNPNLYKMINGISISSKGTVGSICLFSNKPLNKLNQEIIYVTSQSETSIALLKIILKKFNRVDCSFKISKNPELENNRGFFLLIGDDALIYKKKFDYNELNNVRYVYDLGELWFEKTRLPFVFALWIVRNDIFNSSLKSELLQKFSKDIIKANIKSIKNLENIAKYCSRKDFLTEKEIINYWKNLDYEFTIEHKRGLERFRKYNKIIG